MKYQAHRGVSSECPENTGFAFRAALAQGYDIIELDPKLTADGQWVVLHDRTLNRTCRNADGSELSEEVFIEKITCEQALTYDAGIRMGKKFKGEKIPLLQDVLNWAAQVGMPLKIDNCVFGASEEKLGGLIGMIRESGAVASVTCNTTDRVRRVISELPDMPVHYDGPVTEEILREISEIVGRRFTAWVPLEIPATAWCKVPFATPGLCTAVHRYADLGLWILSQPEELSRAKELGADVIETTGSLKPPHPVPGFYDTHCHTCYSPDSEADPAEICRLAPKKGVVGVSFTDHCELRKIPYGKDGRDEIRRSAEDARRVNGIGGTEVFRGVEVGGGILFPEEADAFARDVDFDLIVCTRHGTMFDRYHTQARVDFSQFTETELDFYLRSHLADVLKNVQTQDLDVVAHLTSFLRYINGKYHRNVDMADYAEEIDRILMEMIRRGVALEVNTSNINSSSYAYNEYMPHRAILERYRQLGGYLITLGSDAHTPDRIGNHFAEAWQMLQKIGFPDLYYFRDRMAIPYIPQI